MPAMAKGRDNDLRLPAGTGLKNPVSTSWPPAIRQTLSPQYPDRIDTWAIQTSGAALRNT